ncbi:MAG: hypothetical protein JWP89_4724 [Schlesneria sp.]|nr:hypothetical protein [Schlesneria sp.]
MEVGDSTKSDAMAGESSIWPRVLESDSSACVVLRNLWIKIPIR